MTNGALTHTHTRSLARKRAGRSGVLPVLHARTGEVGSHARANSQSNSLQQQSGDAACGT